MKKVILLAVFVALCCSSNAQKKDQETTAEVIINPSIPLVSGENNSAIPPQGMKPGSILDVWLQPKGYTGGVPKEQSFVTMLDNGVEYFNMGRYADEKEMESNIGKPMLRIWKCYLKIKTPGKHLLIGEFRKGEQEVYGMGGLEWQVQFRLEKELLLDEKIKFLGNAGEKFTKSRTFPLTLQPGYYAIKLIAWMPDQESIWNHKPLTFALRIREPGAMKPREIGVEDIFYKE